MSREIRSLTGLRGVASLYVVLFHIGPYGFAATLPGRFIGHGYIAVDLFFVLSGFVMAMTHHQVGHDGLFRGFADFMARRAARILPLHLSLLGVCTALIIGFGFGTMPGWRDEIANILLIQSWGLTPYGSVNPPSWSISTEWAVYLTFPILTFLCLRSHKITIILVACGAFLLLGAIELLPGQLTHPVGAAGPLNIWSPSTPAPILRCLAEFSLGLLTWRLWHEASPRSIQTWRRLCPAYFAILLVIMTVTPWDMVIVAMFPLLILGLASDTGLVARWLSYQPIHRLGVISYSIYLVHYPVLWIGQEIVHIEGFGPRGFNTVAALVLCSAVGLAHITYKTIEKPAQRWTYTRLRRLQTWRAVGEFKTEG